MLTVKHIQLLISVSYTILRQSTFILRVVYCCHISVLNIILFFEGKPLYRKYNSNKNLSYYIINWWYIIGLNYSIDSEVLNQTTNNFWLNFKPIHFSIYKLLSFMPVLIINCVGSGLDCRLSARLSVNATTVSHPCKPMNAIWERNR